MRSLRLLALLAVVTVTVLLDARPVAAQGWKPYVDKLMADKSRPTGGGIYGKKDGAAWAADGNCNPTPADVLSVVGNLSDKTRPPSLTVGGTKYMYLGVNDGTAVFKKGDSAICARASGQAIVFAMVKGPPQGCVAVVVSIVDLLVKAKY